MPMLPVADVLLIERKLCKCGSIVENNSPFRYRLFKACQGEPDKTEIRKLKDFPEKSDEMGDLTPLPDRVISYHEIRTPWCAQCFQPNMSLDVARSIRPPAPFHSLYLTSPSVWTKAQSGATGKAARKPRLTLADL